MLLNIVNTIKGWYKKSQLQCIWRWLKKCIKFIVIWLSGSHRKKSKIGIFIPAGKTHVNKATLRTRSFMLYLINTLLRDLGYVIFLGQNSTYAKIQRLKGSHILFQGVLQNEAMNGKCCVPTYCLFKNPWTRIGTTADLSVNIQNDINTYIWKFSTKHYVNEVTKKPKEKLF